MKQIKNIASGWMVVCLGFFSFNSFAQAPFSTPDNVGSGNGLDFNGVNNYVDCGNAAAFNFDRTNTFTIEGWFRTNAATVGIDALVTKITQTGSFPGWAALLDNGRPRIQLVNNNTSNKLDVMAANAFDDTEWHFVAFTYDGSSTPGGINIYVDGQLQAVNTVQNNLTGTIATTRPLTYGGRTSSQFFDGQMDEVRVWNVVRTQQEIRDEMCTSLTGNETGLVGYWNMNDATSTMDINVVDNSGNGNNGTLN